ncbi:MAG: translocation/assembly module TamB domain-containing protein [Vicinamibacteria bacterium]
MTRFAQILLRLAAFAVFLLAAAVVALRTPPAREALGGAIARAGAAQGFAVRLGEIEIEPLRRGVVLRDFSAESAGPEQVALAAAEVRVQLAWRALLGAPALERVEIRDARLRVTRRQAPLAPPPAAPAASAEGSGAALTIGSLRLDALAIEYEDAAAGVVAKLPALAIELASAQGRATGAVEFRGEGRLASNGETQPLVIEGGPLALEADSLELRSLALRLGPSSLRASGRVDRLTRAPAFDLRLSGTLDPASLGAAAGELRGSLPVTARVTGPVAEPRLEFAVEDGTLAWGALPPLRVRAAGALAEAAVELRSLSADWAGGRVEGELRAGLESDSGQGRLRWRGLDAGLLARQLGAPPGLLAGGLDGEARLRWRAARLDAVDLTARLLANGQGAPAELAVSGESRLEARGGGFTLGFSHGLGDAVVVTAQLAGRLGSSLAASTLEGPLRLELRDAASLLRHAGSAVPVAGRLDAALRLGGTLGRPDLRGPIEGSLRYEERPVRVTGGLAADASGIALDGVRIELPKASATLDARARWPDGTLAGTLAARVDALGELPGVSADLGLAGRARAEITLGGTLSTPSARGPLSGEDLRVLRRTLGAARADVDLDGGRLQVVADVPELAAHGRLEYERRAGRAGLELELRDSDLARLLPPLADGVTGLPGRISASLSARGTLGGAEPKLESLRLQLGALAASRAGLDVRLERPAEVRFDGRALQVDGLALRIAESRLELAGRSAGAEVPLLEARLEGRLQDLREALVSFVGDANVPKLEGDLAARVSLRGAPGLSGLEGEIRVTGGRLDLGGQRLSSLGARAVLSPSGARLEELTASWRGAALAASGVLPWRLVEALPASWRARASAADGPARLTATLRGLDVAGLVTSPAANGSDNRTAASGSLDADLTLEAGALEASALRGSASITPRSVSLARAPIEAEPLRLELAGGRLRLEPWQVRGAGTDLRLDAELTLVPGRALEAAALAAGLRGDVDLELLSPFLPFRTAGQARLELRAGGSPARPSFAGEARISDGLVVMRAPRLLAEGVAGRLLFDGSRLQVLDFSGELNGGKASLSGELALSGARPTAGRIAFGGKGVGLEWPQDWRSELDLDLVYSVEGRRQKLSGEVQVLRGGYRRNLIITALARQALQAAPVDPALLAAPSAFDRMQLDVRVRSSEELVIDTNFGRAGLLLDLRSVGTYAHPGLLGRVSTEPGAEVYFGGLTYAVESGLVTFANASAVEPQIDASATTNAGGKRVTVRVSGAYGRLRTQLSSDPPLSESQITSLLLTGRSDSSAAADSAQVLASLSGGLLGAAGSALGLESVRVERGQQGEDLDFDPTEIASEADPSARLTFTKRLGSRLRVTFSQDLKTSGNLSWIVGYSPLPGIETRVSLRDDQSYALQLRHDVQLGGPKADAGRQRSPEIRAIRIEGAQALSEHRLRSRLRLRPGKRFDVIHWNQDRERLEQLLVEAGRYAGRVGARRESATDADGRPLLDLVYSLHEGPPTRVEIAGASPGQQEALRGAAIDAWREMPIPAFLEPEAELRARRRLAREGFVRAAAKATASQQANGSRLLRLEVTPGPRAATRRLELAGAATLDAAAIEARVQPLLLDGIGWIDPARVEEAVLSVASAAGLVGTRVRVGAARVEAEVAVLPVEIQEGKPLRLGRLSVRGPAGIGEPELLGLLALEPEARLTPSSTHAALERVSRRYEERGYMRASLRWTGSADLEDGRADLTLVIAEGPRRTLARVEVSGRRTLRPELIEKAVGLAPGDALDPEALARATRRLYETGAVRSAEVAAREPQRAPEAAAETPAPEAPATAPSPEASAAATPASPSVVSPEAAPRAPAPAEEALVVDVKLQEWPAWRLRYGLQLVGDENPLSDVGQERFSFGAAADVTRRNLFGRLLNGGVSGAYRGVERELRGYLSKPRFLDRAIRSSLYLEYVREKLFADVTEDLFLRESRKATLEQRIGERGEPAFAWSYELDLLRFRTEIPIIGELVTDWRIATVNLTGALDRRDDLMDPRQGSFSSLNFQWGDKIVGSELDLRRLLAQQFLFVRLPARATFATAARYERVSGQALSLLASERLRATGPNTVRGYENDDSLIRDIIAGLGGSTSLLVLNQELRLRLTGFVGAVGFFDYGLISGSLRGATEREGLSSLGLGLRFTTPVGLIRFDWAQPLDPDSRGQKKPKYYLGLGHAF